MVGQVGWAVGGSTWLQHFPGRGHHLLGTLGRFHVHNNNINQAWILGWHYFQSLKGETVAISWCSIHLSGVLFRVGNATWMCGKSEEREEE